MKKVIALVVTIIVLLGLYSMSVYLINNGVSSADVVYENTKDEIKAPDIKEEEQFNKVSKLYDSEDLDKRCRYYLSDNYNYYSDVFNYISENYESVFDEIDSNYTESGDKSNSYNYLYGEDLNFDDFFNYDYIGISYGPKIVNMFNNTYIVYSYNYPNTKNMLIVYDYSDVKLNTFSTKVFDFGQEDTLNIDMAKTKLLTYDEFSILFVKGVSVI